MNPIDELAAFEEETKNVVSSSIAISAMEQEYYENLKNCVFLPTSHVEKPNDKNIVKLYAVTTIASADRYGGTRTPGIFTSFDKAKEVIEKNMGDIWECSYSFAVIEAIKPDQLYGAIAGEYYWFAWQGDHTGAYKAIEVPKMYDHTFGFGIG